MAGPVDPALTLDPGDAALMAGPVDPALMA